MGTVASAVVAAVVSAGKGYGPNRSGQIERSGPCLTVKHFFILQLDMVFSIDSIVKLGIGINCELWLMVK